MESYWHGVPLFPIHPEERWTTSRCLNFVCVRPKHSTVVREVRTKEGHTKIKYRRANTGSSTWSSSMFSNSMRSSSSSRVAEDTEGPLPYNYGLLPRTFLGPSEQVLGLGKGDNGPVECVEVNSTNGKS